MAMNIFIGLILLLVALELAFAGYFLGQILAVHAPGRNPLDLLNGWLVYYFLFDLLIRVMAQPLPRISVDSLRHLPVSKSVIVRYMVLRTVPDVFNVLPFLFLGPASATVTIPEAGVQFTVFWLGMLLLMVLASGFFATWLKRLMGWNPRSLLLATVVFALILVLDRIGMLSLTSLSASFFRYLPAHPHLLVIPAGWLAATWWIHVRFLKKHLYPDEVARKRRKAAGSPNEAVFLRSFGLTGTFIDLEMKLFLRNKRTRTILFLLPVFILYGLIFFRDGEVVNSNMLLMFIGLFMTGGLMINYTNYAFGYESIYFDALLSKPVGFGHYIRVKYTIAAMVTAISFLLTVPYVFFSVRVLYACAAMALFNAGIVAPIMLWMATMNRSRMDLSRGGAFNYQGMGVSNWLSILPAFLLPLGINLLCKFIGYPSAGLPVIAVLGMAGLICSGFLLELIHRRFIGRRYTMAAGFREK